MLPHVAQRPDASKLGVLVTLSDFGVSLVLVPLSSTRRDSLQRPLVTCVC